MKRVAVHFASGFEEVEALTVVDLLRRAGIEVIMTSIYDDLFVKGAHDIIVKTDKSISEVDYNSIDMIILPGGMPGTTNLDNNEYLKKQIQNFYDNNKYLAAICAAPMIFGKMGLLKGKKALSYPGFEKYLEGAEIPKNLTVVKSDNIISSRGLGTAIDFSSKIIEILINEEKSIEIKKAILY